MKRVLPLVAAVFLVGGGSATAWAACVKEGTVSDISVEDDAGLHMVSLRTGGRANFVYQFTTTDQDLVAIAVSAMVGQVQAEIEGDAASCPGSGAARSGGNLVEILLF